MRILRQIHARVLTRHLPISSTSFLLSKILSFAALSPLGNIDYARKLFIHIPNPNTFSYNSIIRGFCFAKHPSREPFCLYKRMVKRGWPSPNTFTIAFVLKACAIVVALEEGLQVHACVLRSGFGSNSFVQSSLLNFYAKCEEIRDARTVFEEIPERNLVCWSAMISGYARVGMVNNALEMFREMQKAGIEPDEVSLVSVISACAVVGALDIGKWVHAYIKRKMIDCDLELNTALVNMYAKCGCVEKSKEIFDGMSVKDAKAWSSMIVGLAIHGLDEDALEVFSRMEDAKVKPNHVTFIGILSACAHAGLVSEGQRYWSRMLELGLEPSAEHYGCMVDLLSRGNLIDEAINFIENMPILLDAGILRALLVRCKESWMLKQAETVAEQLIELEPLNAENYIILSNLYASAKQWEKMSRVRKQMKEKGIKAVPGCTSIEVDGFVHEFVMGDWSHPEAQDIRRTLKDISVRIRDSGHKPRLSDARHNVSDEEKEDALSEHCERLAIAYGILKTKAPAPIRIVKNLRVCGDCHEVTKIISKIYEREIIVRDRIRFHKFVNGTCSCKDFW